MEKIPNLASQITSWTSDANWAKYTYFQGKNVNFD